MLHACSGIAISVVTLGNANMLDTTYAYSCMRSEKGGSRLVKEAQAMLSSLRGVVRLHNTCNATQHQEVSLQTRLAFKLVLACIQLRLRLAYL